MIGTQRLLRWYPEPFRARWGDDLADEVRLRGVRALPGLAHGLVDTWLHPVIWPAGSAARRRGRAAAMAVAVAAACGYLVHLVSELDGSVRYLRGPLVTVVTLGVLAGLLLIAPRPQLTRAAAGDAVRGALRGLTIPAAAAAAVVLWVRFGSLGSAPLRWTLLIGWYAVLAVAAIQACRLAARFGSARADPPAPGRLRAGLWTLTATSVAAGALVIATPIAAGVADPLSLVAGVALLGAGWAAAGTVRDIGRLG
jgi:hypothetical protein